MELLISNRIKYIDIFKGIGILFMIMGHIDFGKVFDIYIHAFHMPMFFFISGFLYNYLNFKIILKRKTKSLLIPYISFGLFNFLMYLMLIPNINIRQYFEIMFFYNNKGLPICGALWFLTCLFFTNIIFFCIIKACSKLNQIFVFIVIVLFVAIMYFTKVRLPFSIDSAIYMLPIFYCGFLFKDFYKIFKYIKEKLQIYIGILLLLIFSFMLFKNGYVNVRINEYNNIFLFYINALCLTIGYFYLANNILSKFRCFNILEYIGQNSLIFLCLNQLIILIILKLKFSNCFVILILTILLIAIINELIRHIRKHFSLSK